MNCLRFGFDLDGRKAQVAFQVGVLDELITSSGVSIDIFCGVPKSAIQALGWRAMIDMRKTV